MKKTFLFFSILASFLLMSIPLSAQSQAKLTMSFNDEALISIFQRLESHSDYKFVYDNEEVSKYKVTLDVTNATVPSIVDQALRNTNLKYTVAGKLIKVMTRSASTNGLQNPEGQKKQTIKGYVYEKDTNEPVIGAHIKVLGTDVKGVTDVDGAFHLDVDVKPQTKVEVSYLGMKTVQLPVSKEMKIFLVSDVKELKGVVVTGIFRKAKESYTGAVSTIDRKQLDMYRGSNLLQTLKNIDASVNFPTNNLAGSNPNVLPNINIRGTASLPMSVEEFNKNASQTVNTPLIIMDGFEISLTKLMDYNDEQIESINILKDAAATAIYGSRGANGVIVVITKQPKEGKLRVTAKAGLSLEIPDLTSYHLLNAAQKLDLEVKAGLYSRERQKLQLEYNEVYNKRLKNVVDGIDTDWIHKPVRTGVGQRYNVQLDGGAQAFRWAASLGYNGIEGAMKTSNRRTITGDITLLYSIKNLIFRNYTSFASNKSNESKYGSFSKYVDAIPYFSPYDKNGRLVPNFPNLFLDEKPLPNPLYDASLNTINSSAYQTFLNNFSIEWLITDALRVRAKLGVSTERNNADRFLPAEHSYFNSSEYNTPAGLMRKGYYRFSTGMNDMVSGNITMSYAKTFAEKHQVYVGLDYSISSRTYTDYNFEAEGFSNSDLNFMANAKQYKYQGAPYGDRNIVRMVGATGNVNYTYDNRYYGDFSFRVDGNSKFGSEKRFAPFYSLGAGWNIHNEKFMKAHKAFSNLRLKASYGISGSQDFSVESVNTTYRYYSDKRYLLWSAAELMGYGNPSLTWQNTREINVGTEIGLFENRIMAEINYYDKNTTNLLSSMDMPLNSGFTHYIANIGEMNNKGIEASLNTYIIRDYDRKLNWMIGGQIVYNKNKIIKLSDAIKTQNERYLAQGAEISNLFYEGKPLNSIYAVRSAGIDPSTGKEVFYDKDGKLSKRWNPRDKVYMGSSEPLWRGNFRTTLMYKNFTLNVSFGYHWGGKLYNSTLLNRVEISRYDIADKNVDERVLSQRWLQPGDVSFFKAISNEGTRATSRYVFNDRMLELQNVSLQYRWNTAWLHDKTGIEFLLFGINASNLAYWSSVKFERGTGYPFAHNVQGSITLTF